jgi:hypothetical protein
LERYLNEARKFKFEVYEVNSSSKEVQEAIKNNGEVVVEFYDETIYKDKPNITLSNGGSYWTNDYLYGGINSTTTGDFKLYNNSFITNSASLNTDVDYHTSQNLRKSLQTDRFKETGRIEKGSDSKQEFESVDMDFNVYPSNYSTWRILPLSEKPYTAKEVNVLYCGNCGIRRKKDTHKFCPHCGTKF